MKARAILVLNGPNLDMLGVREPDVYGRATLKDLEDEVRSYAERCGVEVSFFQSNSEGKLINKIHDAETAFDGIVYNPGAHTHYSYALRDAVASINIPVVEVHLSDIRKREPFRRVSVIAPACIAQITGLGTKGYCQAIEVLCERVSLTRLGDGYERFVAPDQAVVVAPVETGAACDLDALAADAPRESAPSAAMSPAAPFADAVASVDAGLLSFERQAVVRSAYEHLGLSALLVRDTSNIRWVTAIDGVFDGERAHSLLLSGGWAVLHTDSRYSNAVRAAAARIGSDVVVSDDRASHAQFAWDALTRNGQGAFAGKLGIEDTITYAEFVKMVDRFQTAGLAPTTDLILGLRAVKDAGELVRLRAAQAITDAAFAHIVSYLKPGMSEREVQWELEDFMLRHGGEALAFRSIVATGANGADPHAVPGDARLEAGQCVVMDFGAKAYGYCSDMTRTVFLGQPESDMVHAWEVLRCANETVEALLKPGVTGAAAHEEAERVLAEGGFGGKMGHGLGHGVGIDVHELPVLNPRSKAPLVQGNVVTVEPGIYLPGRFGMRLEDFGVVTDNGFEVFTQSTHEMVVI